MTWIDYGNGSLYKFVKTDPKDRLEVQLGDVLQSSFYPQVKLKRWDNEVNMSFRLSEDLAGSSVVFDSQEQKLKWIKNDIEVHFYELEESENTPSGGFEMEIILKKKPKTNKLELSANTKELNFYYQPPLDEGEQDPEWATVTATHAYDKDSILRAYRPEHVVGSYAVFHKTRGKVVDSTGKDYKAGKAFHIYRPKVYDANDNWVWAEQFIDVGAGIQTITIPQDFLDNAVYPVRHVAGDTFGYDSEGQSTEFMLTDRAYGALHTFPASNETGDSMSVHCVKGTSTGIKGFVVTHSDLNIISNGVTNAGVVPTGSADWETMDFSTGPSMVASTAYVLMAIIEAGNVSVSYDAGDSNQMHRDNANSYATPENLGSIVHGTNEYSNYLTYTPSGPGAVRRYFSPGIWRAV
jgi:hypothetical protein